MAAAARNAVAGPFVAVNGPQAAGNRKTRTVPRIASRAIVPIRDIIFILRSSSRFLHSITQLQPRVARKRVRFRGSYRRIVRGSSANRKLAHNPTRGSLEAQQIPVDSWPVISALASAFGAVRWSLSRRAGRNQVVGGIAGRVRPLQSGPAAVHLIRLLTQMTVVALIIAVPAMYYVGKRETERKSPSTSFNNTPPLRSVEPIAPLSVRDFSDLKPMPPLRIPTFEYAIPDYVRDILAGAEASDEDKARALDAYKKSDDEAEFNKRLKNIQGLSDEVKAQLWDARWGNRKILQQSSRSGTAKGLRRKPEEDPNADSDVSSILEAVRRRMDQAYTDKFDGKISEELWQRKMIEWQADEQRIETAIAGLKESGSERLLNVKRILELANKAYFLYLTRKPTEQAELLRKVLLNCSIDAVSVTPTYRKPFDMIFQRAKNKEWSGRPDLNWRPLAPQASALPG